MSDPKQRHMERAARVRLRLAGSDDGRVFINGRPWSWLQLDEILAEQFAEVEREARAAFLEEIKAEPHRAALAVLSGYPLPEEMLALQAKLRAVVQAGDALRQKAKALASYCRSGETIDFANDSELAEAEIIAKDIAAYDAATEGIDRETRG